MKNDLKIPFILSAVFHLSIFLVTSMHTKKANYIIVPVELSFFSPIPQAGKASVKSQAEEKASLIKKDDQLVIPKKKLEKKTVTELKKTPKTEDKIDEKQEDGSKDKSKGVGDSDGRLGSQISLETANFPFSYYTNTIVKKIGQNWQWATAFGQIKAVVYFRINRDGTVSELRIKDSSKDSLFDQQAIRAIKLASPFPPLPSGYPENYLGVYFEFAFRE